MRLQKALLMSLTLTSIVSLPRSWADEIPVPDFSCLTRPEKNQILICFKENDECHKSLLKADSQLENDWQVFAGAVAIGILVGAFGYAEIHK